MLLLYFLALAAQPVLAAPANSSQFQKSIDPTQNTTVTSSPSQLIPTSVSLGVIPIAPTHPVTSIASASLPDTTFSLLSIFNNSLVIAPVTSVITISTSSLSSPSVTYNSFPTTVFMTEIVTVFQTTIVGETLSTSSVPTVVVTETATSTTAPTKTSLPFRTQWATPPQMMDLSAFNITYFPTGQRNLHLVSEIPSEAFVPNASSDQSTLFTFPNASTILQLVYPAHSVNPGNKPTGGADFYATPLNLSSVRNVTLEYSVFFPVDFDWVKGGKLPGLFGGHTGCSGGASARDCFSTRLMWRPQGVGELYLYAPKDKQSDALCADVASVCDVAYGFSIGRGAFNFTAGDWTHLAQNVVLNTPGRNDGEFTLTVGGRVVIERKDMFYRDINPAGRKLSVVTPKRSLLGPSTGAAWRGAALRLDEDDVLQPTEFLGLFFSTFFGGHGKQYATPRQQYTWFKDFAITRHD